ncbi:MAG: flavodoxin family protein [Methanobacteriaceae archaeon]|nr:flavodoxin family protein [Methanobacteriaceae archaeon]
MKKVIGIVGSPRKGGNTEFLLNTALNSAKKEGVDVKLICLSDFNINSCVACNKCKTTGECSINDDMTVILNEIKNADGLIVGSPVYFGTMTSQTKMFIDRSRPLRSLRSMKNMVCGAISTGGSRNGGQETTIEGIHNFFFIQQAIVVGDSYPTAHYGGIGEGVTSEDDVGITTASNLGKRVAIVVNQLK